MCTGIIKYKENTTVPLSAPTILSVLLLLVRWHAAWSKRWLWE